MTKVMSKFAVAARTFDWHFSQRSEGRLTYYTARRGNVTVEACYLEPDLHPGHFVFQYATYHEGGKTKAAQPLKSHKAALQVLAGAEKPRFDWYSINHNRCYVPVEARVEKFGYEITR